MEGAPGGIKGRYFREIAALSPAREDAKVAPLLRQRKAPLVPVPAESASVRLPRRDLAWRVIGLVNLYRLLLPPVLIGMQWLSGQEASLWGGHPGPFLAACLAYFSAGLLLIVARRLAWPSLRRVALLNSGVDAAGISFILYASGGVASGAGPSAVITPAFQTFARTCGFARLGLMVFKEVLALICEVRIVAQRILRHGSPKL